MCNRQILDMVIEMGKKGGWGLKDFHYGLSFVLSSCAFKKWHQNLRFSSQLPSGFLSKCQTKAWIDTTRELPGIALVNISFVWFFYGNRSTYIYSEILKNVNSALTWHHEWAWVRLTFGKVSSFQSFQVRYLLLHLDSLFRRVSFFTRSNQRRI